MSGPNGDLFAVKLKNNPQGVRVLVNDHVSAQFGQLVGAPIPKAAIVDVDQSVASTIKFSNGTTAVGGLAHGSKWLVPDVRPVIDAARTQRTTGNPARYLFLDILFDILGSGDHQWVVAWKPPFQVFSVDFGWSLTGQPNWDVPALRSTAVPTAFRFASGVVADRSTLVGIRDKLEAVDDAGIVGCVCELPVEWSIDMDEKVAICQFLRLRLDAVLALLPAA